MIPAEVVENATTQAKLLMDIVEKTKCYKQVRDKKYLQVEAWETIGAFNGVHAETKEVKPISKDQDGITDIVGYDAHVQLLKNGLVVGGARMPCYLTENVCKGKSGEDKHRACMSAAQTFAESKAFRMNYSYVAILAGYQPMPAEEITEDTDDNGRKAKATKPSTSPALDMDWLRDSLVELQWPDFPKWLKDHYHDVRGQTVRAMVESLTWEQQEEIVKEVQKRLEAQPK